MGDEGSAHVCLCVTLYNFQGQNDKELSFTKGEYVKVAKKGSNWWGGVSSKEGRSGYFPSNYVQDIRDSQEVKTLLALYPVLMKPWEAPSEAGDHIVSATAGLVFTRGKDGPTDGKGPANSNTQAGATNAHVLGQAEQGSHPWSQTYTCSCGARLLSLEVAQLHVKNFNLSDT